MAALLLVGGVILAMGSCSRKPGARASQEWSSYTWPQESRPTVGTDLPAVKRVGIFRGSDGKAIGWNDLTEAVAWADVVLVGEVHTDPVAHALQLELQRDILKSQPRTTLSLEFLERNEQSFIDSYLSGDISREEFIEKTGSSTASTVKDGWIRWYQPLIDEAKAASTRVIGANPPRSLVRLAREKGWDALKDVPAEEQGFFALPQTVPPEREIALFREQLIAAAKAHGHGGEVSDEELAKFLRAQELWNATMADSILAEHERGAPKVLHIVGGFHVEQGGGIVRELRHRRPGLRTLVIQLDPDWETPPEGRADIVIHTASDTDITGTPAAGTGT